MTPSNILKHKPLRRVGIAMVAVAAVSGSPGAKAATATDPINDFIATYTGPHGGDLDVVSSFVSYNTATDMFTFSGTVNAAMGTTPGSFYVWGVNRGAGTAGFAGLGTGYPDIKFDAIVRLNLDGSGTVTGTSPATTLPAGTAVLSGSTISATIPGSLLPTRGFAQSAYTWNLWPRAGSVSGSAAISDFAPDGTNLSVTVVPEPASCALMGLGIGLLALLRRRAR